MITQTCNTFFCETINQDRKDNLQKLQLAVEAFLVIDNLEIPLSPFNFVEYLLRFRLKNPMCFFSSYYFYIHTLIYRLD